MRHVFILLVLLFSCLDLFALNNILGQPNPDCFDLSQPNYIISGLYLDNKNSAVAGVNNQVKFRINVNYRLIGDNSSKNGLYFSYTQLSFWNFYDKSSPFFDNNYSPELVAHFDAFVLPEDFCCLPSASLSLKHESNGQSGDIDRSWNRAVFTLEFGHPSRSSIYGYTSVWYPFHYSTPGNISSFTGYGECKLVFQNDAQKKIRIGASASTRFGGGNSFFKCIALEGFVNPFFQSKTRLKWLPSFMVQYYYGYAENMINYNKISNVIRIGLAFVR